MRFSSNLWFWWALASIGFFCEQICLNWVGYCVGRVGQGLGEGHVGVISEVWIPCLGGVLLSSLFPFLTHASLNGIHQRWYHDYLHSTLNCLKQKLHVVSSHTKHQALAWFRGEAFSVFGACSTALALFMGASVGMVRLTVLFVRFLGPQMLGPVFLVLLFSAGLLTCSWRRLTTLPQAEQQAKVRYAEALQLEWDPIFFGDTELRTEAKARLAQKALAYTAAQVASDLFRRSLMFVPNLVGFLLVGGVIWSLKSEGARQYGSWVALWPYLSAFFVQLHGFLSCLIDGISIKGRLQKLREFPQACQGALFEVRIRPKELRWVHRVGGGLPSSLASLEEVCEAPELRHPFEPGRWRISGRNGSGKSSFLLRLKSRYPEACYWGPGVELFPPPEGKPASTGEARLYQLDRLLHREQPSLLLLDEWDAHLDTEHRALMDARLEKEAACRLILEVRHGI